MTAVSASHCSRHGLIFRKLLTLAKSFSFLFEQQHSQLPLMLGAVSQTRSPEINRSRLSVSHEEQKGEKGKGYGTTVDLERAIEHRRQFSMRRMTSPFELQLPASSSPCAGPRSARKSEGNVQKGVLTNSNRKKTLRTRKWSCFSVS